ncbi:M12 family metallo-peptidase [Streptomyces sp. A5-4]|uniref:M12 family metallo-peptidase n=1 Tax=Streptomyces sp. A5-4 TaxID=3384771 RepID=UPI003DAA4432
MTNSQRARRAGLAALCTGALTLSLALTATAAARPAAAPEGEEIVRSRTVPVNVTDYRWLCTAAPFGMPREHTFDLFDDVRLTAVEDGLVRDGQKVTWTGHLKSDPRHNVVLSTTKVCEPGIDPAGVGIDAHFDLSERVFRIAGMRNEPGRLQITEEDPSKHEPSAPDDNHLGRSAPDPKTMRDALERLKKRAAAPGPVIIDMIVGYTPAAARRIGGEQAMDARIKLAQSYINQAFADSNVQASVDIVGTYNTAYYGDQQAATVLPMISNPREPQLGTRAGQLREQYGVDLVSVITDIPDGSSGRASLPMPISEHSDNEAFSVVDVQSITAWYNFGHEVGHNLAMFHDRTTLDDQSGGQGYEHLLTTPYSTGFVTPNRDFHTLMAYSTACGGPCTAVNQYSNTENLVNGEPLGNQYNNNAAVARLTTPVVSGYRNLKASIVRHALTLSQSSGGEIRPATYGPYRAGTTVAVNAITAPGQRVAAWEFDGNRYNITGTQVTVTMDRAHTLKAVFTRN